MKKLLFLLFTIIFLSCNSESADVKKAKAVSEQWVKENVLILYDDDEKATLLSSKEDFETQSKSDYLAEKFKWDGEGGYNEYDFAENLKKSNAVLKLYTDYVTNVVGSPYFEITEKEIAYKNYLGKWTERESKLLDSSFATEAKLDNTENFYVIRYCIKYKDNNPEKATNKDSFDIIDVILDDKFNVINKLD